MRQNVRMFPRYVARVQELIGRTSLWPRAVQRAFFSEHMNNRERFTVIVFLWTNGCPPNLIEKRFQSFEDYDDQAIRHIKWVMNALIRNPNRWRAWNIQLGRSI